MQPASTEANPPTPPPAPKAAKPRPDHGPKQSRDLLGLNEWQWDRARFYQLIADPDAPGGRWSNELIAEVQARLPQILAAVGTHPGYGAVRAARMFTEATRIEGVDVEVIRDLAALGVLPACGDYKGSPLYSEQAIMALVERPELDAAVARRRAFLDSTVTGFDIREQLGWDTDEWHRIARQLGVPDDGYHRHPTALLEQLLADVDLRVSTRRARLLWAREAAAQLRVRPVELDHLVAAGLLTPVHRKGKPGPVDSGDLNGGQFLQGDVEDVRDDETLPWEAMHAVTGSKASPLREMMPRLATRADHIRTMAARLAEQLGVDVQATWVTPQRRRRSEPAEGEWHLRWPLDDAGCPTAKAVAALIDDDPAARYRREIQLSPYTPDTTDTGTDAPTGDDPR